MDELQPERSLSHHPLFQVTFALQNDSGTKTELSGLAIKPVFAETGAAKFDLELNMAETEQGLEGELVYCTDLFKSSTIDRLIGHWQQLLEGIVADPDQRVGELPLLTETERRQLLEEWNETAVAYPQEKTVAELFMETAAQIQSATAVVMGDTSLTYRELDRRTNQLAHYLRKAGVGPDTLVGICATFPGTDHRFDRNPKSGRRLCTPGSRLPRKSGSST